MKLLPTNTALAAALILSSALPDTSVRADGGLDQRTARAERAAEAQYQKLMASNPANAKDWYMIGDWCSMVAADLSDRSRQVFHDRSQQCLQRGKKLILDRLERTLRDGKTRMSRTDSHAAAVEVKREVQAELDSFLGELLPIIKQHRSQASVLLTLETGMNELEAALVPYEEEEVHDKITSGLVKVNGKWVRFDAASPGFAGFVAVSSILESPKRFEKQLLATEIASTLQVFDLLDTTFLDGFDRNGNYLLPNFADDRFVVTIPEKIRTMILDSKTIEQGDPNGQTSVSDRRLYRARLVMNVRKDMKQSTYFYRGDVKQLAVYDSNDNVVLLADVTP